MLLAVVVVVVTGLVGAPPGKGGKPSKVPPIEAVETVRALVMPIEVGEGAARLASADQRRRLENDVAAILQRFRRLTVLTAQDVRKLADMDARRQLAGCDSSCASEIAAALGARYVFGLRLEPGPQGVVLGITLLDTSDAVVLGKGRAQGARLQDLGAQLPFAVKDAAATLEAPGDPTAAEIQNDARPKLAVLPLRGDAPRPDNLALAVDEAAARLAARLGLATFDSERYAAAAARRGCDIDDLGCSLPAAVASHNVSRALGVSLIRGAAGAAPGAPSPGVRTATPAPVPERVVRAALLAADGSVLARAWVVAAGARGEKTDTDAVARAVMEAVDALTTAGAQHAKQPPRGLVDVNEVVEAFPCTIYRGFEAVGAQCTLTRSALRVAPRALNIQSHNETISLADIVSVGPLSVRGAGSALQLTLRDGTVRDIAVGEASRDRLVARITELTR